MEKQIQQAAGSSTAAAGDGFAVSAPTVSLPKGGGAIRGMGEKFTANPVTGTASMTLPIATSPGRSGFGPQLSLSYDSGAGNGIFGLGWALDLPAIARKTDKGLPRYLDGNESDVFVLAGAEDLVPKLDAAGRLAPPAIYTVCGQEYAVREYRPRIEGAFALIERWTQAGSASNTFWRTLTRDNVTTWYGKSAESRIADPSDAARIFQWRVCEVHDDRGNVVTYHYRREDGAGVDRIGVAEANRTHRQRTANGYPDRVRYGNLAPYRPLLAAAGERWPGPDDEPGQQWMFEVVFDYGDHAGPAPRRVPDAVWPVRADPFSTHRAGFEVRTYRLCRRVLMFHHFPTELGAGDCLVRSTDFDYSEPGDLADPGTPGYSVLASVTQRSYQKRSAADAGYESRETPPIAFTYSVPRVDPTVRAIAADALENLPVGIQGPGCQWVDLDGEGLCGVLVEHTGAWHYKANLGDTRFGPARVVAKVPAMAASRAGRAQLMDLGGDGEVDLVEFAGPTPGFHEREHATGWKRFVPFAALPNLDWDDPNLRFVDLTGDGRADVLLTEHEVFTWYASLGNAGFADAERTQRARDEDAGPRLVFADGTQTVFVADLSGDGLSDLVRIRNGELCYWPSLGYGRFGRKITFGNSPRFDHDDHFDPRRVRLADIDGSGPADVIYLGRNGAQLYFNRSGNSLSEARTVEFPVATENLAAVQVVDLLGNGTACLVWNSHLPADARHPVRYIDLMAGREGSDRHRDPVKPHLLIGVDNNLGAATEIEYTPSTRFYLQDKQSGTPWITRLPFPVQCVSKVSVRDKWRGTTFSSTYSYHHGYFDGGEREFRGFGRVERVDVEDFGRSAANNAGSPFVTRDQTLYQPPVQTVTWYHTGAALDRERTLRQFDNEYFPSRFAGRLPDPGRYPASFREKALPEPELPADLSGDEWREALRACKGMMLRQEVYELAVDDLAAATPRHTPVRLFSAAVHNCRIRRLQARGANLHAVFLVTESEALTYHYELALPANGGAVSPDPRVAHTLNLRHDDQGNPQQSIAIGYGRWSSGAYPDLPHPELADRVQRELHVAYTETRYTQDVVLPARTPGDVRAIRHRRLRMPCEVLTCELAGVGKADPHYYALSDFGAYDLSEEYGHRPGETPPPRPVQRKEYHEHAHGQVAQKRIVEHTRTLFFDDADDSAPPVASLPLGRHGPRGLKYEDYRLALTNALLDAVFTHRDRAGNVIDEKLTWQVEPGVGTTPPVTARDVLDRPVATGSPYLASGYVLGSALDASSNGQYWMRSGVAGFAADAHRHFFLPERYTDPFGNVTAVEYDARDLFVRSTTDARGNSVSVDGFDYRVLAPREIVDSNGNRAEAAFDIRGLVVAAATKGKYLDGQWQADTLAGLDFDLLNPPAGEVVRFCVASVDDRGRAATWLGNASTRFVYHFGDEGGRWATRPAGACAIAREQHVGRLAPGRASPLQIALECSDGSGTVLMKKIQAEPERPGGPRRWLVNGLTVLNNKGKPVRQYEPSFVDDFGCQLPVMTGVSSTLYYDAVGRTVRTEFPDGTLSRVAFSPWHVSTFDQNDTVTESRWYRERLTAAERLVDPRTADPGDETRANAASAADKRAAGLAAHHAETPALTLLDSLGREAIAVAHNRTPDASGAWADEFSLTHTRLDAEGKPLWIRDARGNLVMQYINPVRPSDEPGDDLPYRVDRAGQRVYSAPCYDIAGNLLFQHGMDAGARWMLNDAAGKPLLAWDFNERTRDDGTVLGERRLFHTRYDALHRPIEQRLVVNDGPPALVEAFEHVDTESFRNGGTIDQAALAQAQRDNLIGQPRRHYDPSGLATVERVDFAGNVEEVTRTLVADVVAAVVDWNVATRSALLEDETFRQITEYDALGRPTTLYNWHRDSVQGNPVAGHSDRVAVYVPTYNERGLLQSETVHVRVSKATLDGKVRFVAHADAGRTVQAIRHIAWNAKGQKRRLELGNGTLTHYTYDEQTFRLVRLYTRRDARFTDDCAGHPAAPDTDSPPRSCGVQNLHYTYDPVGNITQLRDDAQDTVWFANAQVDAAGEYVYDASYRLIEATGRENTTAQAPLPHPEGDWPVGPMPSAGALNRYTRQYVYDRVGNFVEMRHRAQRQAGQPSGDWTRHYAVRNDSNRLDRTWYGADTTSAVVYRHDPHGSLLNLANTAPGVDLRWDWRDMIRALDLQGGGQAYYNYGIDKQRTRKTLVRNPAVSGGGTVREDRIYLDGYELYRRRNPQGAVVEEIESLHLFEGEQRMLLIDDVIASAQPRPDGRTVRAQTLWRYQYGNHLGSVGVELDESARVISYEEFHPYGTAAYRMANSALEAPQKRYRYAAMERDEESGLSYHAARFQAPWLGRWVSADPSGMLGGINTFAFADLNPLSNVDDNGRQPSSATQNLNPDRYSLLDNDQQAEALKIDASRFTLLGNPPNPLDVVKNPALFLLTLGQIRQSVQSMPLVLPITEREKADYHRRHGPQLWAGPTAADAVMRSSLFPPHQMKLMYDAIQMPVLGAALPAAAAGLGTYAVGSGYYALASGDYQLAQGRFLLGMGLLSSSTVGFELSAMRAATANASRLQATLESQIFGSKDTPGMFSPALRSESVIATGVMRDQGGRFFTAVTVNNGFRSKLARELSLLAEEHGASFVSGATHAERNLIGFARQMNLRISGLPMVASSPVCEVCAVAGHEAGVMFQNNLRGYPYMTKGWKAMQKGGYVAPESAPLSPDAADWVRKFSLFPGL